MEAYQLILNQYYEPGSLEKADLIRGAIEGMLSQLPDQYNTVYTKEEYAKYRQRQKGNYVGVGMEITKEDDFFKVIATFPDAPAYKSGILSGDTILSIDGKSAQGLNVKQVTEAIQGKKGTEVTLEVKHPNGKKEKITMTRKRIQIPAVEMKTLPKNNIALLDVNTFNRRTPKELEEALDKLKPEKLTGYIVDLRNNSGGLLDPSVSVASKFVDDGLITKLVAPKKVKKYKSRGNSIPNLPLVLLINKSSASASELVAAAIRDHGMGILVGQKSFGKGLVQTTYSIDSGLKVKLSSYVYLTPSGDKVPPEGLTPDLKSTKRSQDLKRAISWIKNHENELMPLESNQIPARNPQISTGDG